MSNNNVEDRVIGLAKKIEKLSEEDHQNIIDLAEHNEWGVALDSLCHQLYEYDIKITKSDYDEICGLGKEMGMNVDEWLFLKELVLE